MFFLFLKFTGFFVILFRIAIYSKKSMIKKLINPPTSYEILFILAGSLHDNETKKELEKWETELSKFAKVLTKAEWSRRDLAYKIASETTGTYFVAHFETDGTKIAEFDNSLRLAPKVIRHLIYKTPKNYEWVEYSNEDLEHDFTKLKSVVVKNEGHNEKSQHGTPARKKTVKPIAKKTEKKTDAGTINKKLDDILADL